MFGCPLFVDQLVTCEANVPSAFHRNDEALLRRCMRSMATQARHFFSLTQRVRYLGNRMGHPGVSEALRGVELDFRNSLEIGPRDLLSAEKSYRFASDLLKPVAGKAE